MEEAKRCMTCMEEYTEGVCPKCGSENKELDQKPFLKKGTVLQGRYLVGAVRESNSEGVTYAAYDQANHSKILLREFFPQAFSSRAEDGKNVAVLTGGEEVFSRTKESFLELSRKIAHYRDLASILPIFDIFSENNTAYAVYEWSHGGSLKEYIERKGTPMSWNMARSLFLPLQFALGELHAAGIGHYGISPENLYLYADGKMKLAGFCIGELRREEQELAPELFAGCAALEQYTSNQPLGEYTDVYGYSACLFFALTTTLPQEALRRKYDNRLLIPNSILEQIPNSVITALSGGMQVSVSDRLKTFEDFHRVFVGTQIAEETQKKEEDERVDPVVSVRRQERAQKARRALRLPDFLVAAAAFLVTFLLLWNFGWDYLGVSKDISWLFASSENTSSVVSEKESRPTSSSPEVNSGTESTESVVSIPEGAIEVPSLIGMTLAKAQETQNFKVFQTESAFDDAIKEGCVISQSIEGYAMPGSVITVVISKGPSQRTLPNVVGQSLSRATAMLAEQGFTVGSVISEKSTAENDTVLRFRDSAAIPGTKYEVGTVFDLIVSEKVEESAPESISE